MPNINTTFPLQMVNPPHETFFFKQVVSVMTINHCAAICLAEPSPGCHFFEWKDTNFDCLLGIGDRGVNKINVDGDNDRVIYYNEGENTTFGKTESVNMYFLQAHLTPILQCTRPMTWAW